MRILALEPYYGGSHQAFLDGWIAHSQHEWTVVSLPAYHWKWRMRHAAITMARRACLALLGLSCILPSSLGFPAWLKCNRLLEEDEVRALQ